MNNRKRRSGLTASALSVIRSSSGRLGGVLGATMCSPSSGGGSRLRGVVLENGGVLCCSGLVFFLTFLEDCKLLHLLLARSRLRSPYFYEYLPKN